MGRFLLRQAERQSRSDTPRALRRRAPGPRLPWCANEILQAKGALFLHRGASQPLDRRSRKVRPAPFPGVSAKPWPISGKMEDGEKLSALHKSSSIRRWWLCRPMDDLLDALAAPLGGDRPSPDTKRLERAVTRRPPGIYR